MTVNQMMKKVGAKSKVELAEKLGVAVQTIYAWQNKVPEKYQGGEKTKPRKNKKAVMTIQQVGVLPNTGKTLVLLMDSDKVNDFVSQFISSEVV